MKRLIPILISILIAGTAYGQFPATGLVAWYPFCADTTDHGGTGYDLINHNLSPVNSRFGNPQKAWNFNGSNSEMHYSTSFAATGDFTYSVWVNLASTQSSIIFYNGDPALNGFGMVINDGVTLGTAGNQLSLLWGGVGMVSNYGSLSIGFWHHIVLIRFGNSYQVTVDNVAKPIYFPGTPPVYNAVTNVFALGSNILTGGDAFSGQIDDVAVYSRSISTMEITRLFNFNPDIVFTIGPDTTARDSFYTCNKNVTLFPSPVKYTTPPPFPSTGSYPSPAFNYSWNTSATTTSIVVTPPDNPVDYILYINKDYYCPGTDTIKIRHISVKVNIGPRDTTFCSGNVIYLNDSTYIPNETYLWSTGDTTRRLKVEVSGLYWLNVDSTYTNGSTIGHCYGSDTTSVQIALPRYAHLGRDTSLCLGGTLNLQSSDTYHAPSFIWGGPNPVGAMTTPVTTATTTGTYWVQVTDSTCVVSDTINIKILYDTLTLYNPDTAICRGQSVIARVTGNSGITYQWTPTAGVPLYNTQTPIITPDTSAYYVVTGTIQDCYVRDSFYIDVQPYPRVFLGTNRNVCQHDTLHILPSVTPTWFTHYIYDWTPGTNLDDSTINNAVFTAGDSTHLVLVVTTSAGCRGADSIEIFMHHGDFLDPMHDTSVCPNMAFQFHPKVTDDEILAGTTATYTFHSGTYLDDSTSSAPWVRAITTTEYTVVGTSQFNCTDTTAPFTVTVLPNAIIYLGDSVTLYPGDSLIISPQTNCTRFSWFPPEGLNDSTASNPIAKPVTSTAYSVYARTEDGCAAFDTLKVRVTPFTLLDLPNAFTPGAGINNYFSIIKKGAARLRYFRIYDRWGVMVYNSTDIDAGWNGKYKEVEQPFGVYIYELEAVTDRGKVFHKQGNVTLIR